MSQSSATPLDTFIRRTLRGAQLFQVLFLVCIVAGVLVIIPGYRGWGASAFVLAVSMKMIFYHVLNRHISAIEVSRDPYRKGGDSLMGRYHYYHLHPFSAGELSGTKSYSQPFTELRMEGRFSDVDALDRFGGFPEPFLAQKERALRRWHNERLDRLFREDIRDVEIIRDLGRMKMMSDMLPSKVGSLLSINAIREDLEVSHRAASHWLDILEAFHYHFRIHPFTRKTFRSLRKVPKLYLWDWSEITNEVARFENLVASHLLKFVDWWHDREGYRTKLCFLRDTEQHEVDFLVTVDEKPWFAVEVKLQEESVDKSLGYFGERLKIPFSYQVLKKKGVDKFIHGVRVVSADKFLLGLI